MKLAQIDSLARPPHGLLVRRDLLANGLAARTWRRAVTAGALIEVMPGVAVVPTRPITDDLLMAAAVVSVGPGAVLSHRSAARVWGIDGLPDRPIDVTRSDPRLRVGPLERHGVVVHRPIDLMDLRPVTVNDVPVTNPVRTLLDLGAVAPHAVDRALTHFRVARKVTIPQMCDALERHSRHGRAGIGALRKALAEQQLDDRPADSVLEEAMARLAKRFHLPPLQFQARLVDFRVDFWIIGTRLYLECDGWAAHGLNRNQFEFDRRRTAVLSAAGYVGIRFTWRQVVREPQVVAALIWHNIERWAPELL